MNVSYANYMNLVKTSELYILYISGVRSSGHRVKPNMAVNGGPNLRRLSLPTRSFMFTCIVKMEQGDWNRRNLEPPCPPYLASLFARSVTGRSHSICIYGELTGENVLVYYCKCCNFIAYATRYIFVNRYQVAASNVTCSSFSQKQNAYSSFFEIILKKYRTQVCFY